MKLLVLVSTLDLQYRLGCTPAWWQFLKAFHETGNEVIAIPYLGDPIESPWWRTYPNPCSKESKIAFTLSGWKKIRLGEGGISAYLFQLLIRAQVRSKWEKFLFDILSRERDVDAILMLNVPVNHFTGIPSELRNEFGVRIAYFDGDMPTILPEYVLNRGFRFNYYEGANLGEYDVFFSNSKGALPAIRALGAKDARPLYWAVDPDLFRPIEVPEKYDISFYGHGSQLREHWMEELIARPSEVMPDKSFIVGGGGFEVNLGNARLLERVPFSSLGRFVGQSRINLNITRSSHAETLSSATSRPFELAAYGACIVSQPYKGIKEWFEVDREILLAGSYEEAVGLYRWLLDDQETRKELGCRARERILKEHTFRHRAADVLQAIH